METGGGWKQDADPSWSCGPRLKGVGIGLMTSILDTHLHADTYRHVGRDATILLKKEGKKKKKKIYTSGIRYWIIPSGQEGQVGIGLIDLDSGWGKRLKY